MTNEIAKLEKMDPEKLKLIKSTIAKDCTDTELSLLLYQADRLNLDPLQRQIWAVKYADKPALIFVGRDGYLQFAHRSGQLDGFDSEPIHNEKGELTGAVAHIYRKDWSHPVTVRVKFSEYDKSGKKKGTKENNWDLMPETMICKVAESQGFRKAFAISGVYSPEEIDTEKYQGEVITVTPEEKPAGPAPKWVEKEREKEAKKKQPVITAS